MSILLQKQVCTSKPDIPEFDFTHPVVRNATSLVSFHEVGTNGEPWDDAAKEFWTANTLSGTIPYQKQNVAGAKQLARQDIDNAGIVYQAPITLEYANTGKPFWFMLSYTILEAPDQLYRGVFAVQGSARAASFPICINSQDTTYMRVWCASAFRFQNVPVAVGEKHFVIYRYDGVGNHDFYDSQYGSWRTEYLPHDDGSDLTDGFWLGTGYLAELPCAFEYVVGAFNYAPTTEELESLALNPYQVFKPKKRILSLVEAGTGFNPAWAREANNLIGAF